MSWRVRVSCGEADSLGLGDNLDDSDGGVLVLVAGRRVIDAM